MSLGVGGPGYGFEPSTAHKTPLERTARLSDLQDTSDPRNQAGFGLAARVA